MQAIFRFGSAEPRRYNGDRAIWLNGYRSYTVAELRKVLVISSLRKTIYYIENLKDLLGEIEGHRYATVDQSFQYALQRLNDRLEAQFHGIAELMKYIGLTRSHEA